MSFAKLLRIIILGLISLFGILILVGLAAWWHYWFYGTLNPDKVRPLEDWTLGLGVGVLYMQGVTLIEALLISLATRLRWIKFNRGRNAVGLLSLMLLSLALPKGITSATPSEIVSLLLYLLYLTLPVIPAWCLLSLRRNQGLVNR
ncbi:hypothetical protein [Leptothoe spongobia]|uniref:Uncharacterized protein n=1 Tax=Leptothoe spongobia TAU-MAC 1115 TaxID=1967444 RepID=A0A947DIT4_9CYAN|nr:hypothetical protein [Leptothoe spongobia]MBT9317419.1 hypothetical protein [Leptothoe spongobia TAU-MAC 1115]